MEQTPDNKQWRWQQRWNLEQDLAAIGRLIDRPLWVKIIIAMFLGLGLGIAISPQGGQLLPEASALSIAGWLKLPGSIFLNMIQMVVIPLIISSIILGVASSGDPAYLRRVGLRIFPYFISTTIIAVTIGIFLASSIEPGQYIDAAYLQQFIQQGQAAAPTAAAPPQSLPERISSLVPANISAAQLNKDMLQIVIYALFFAVAIVALPSQRRQPLLSLLESIQDACLKLIGWAMLLAPYAVFGLLADIAIRVGLNAMLGVSAYMGTVVLGLLLLLCLYVLVAWALAKQPPLKFLSSIRSAQLLAFSTSSSAAVMPL
ncbi:MAG: dicarboxylate/amino acid:cation symporter, partial [Cellvibrionaceae bacterium]|nr:dicarboxylate/amino acid:cation symporter [Cellvibrionaceae bacterium]